MTKLKNEEGYVLIIIILFVVLIMGFSSIFMVNAISHTKQEEVVDQEHLTVAAAEMGVDYYSTALLNRYESSLDYLYTQANEEVIRIMENAPEDLNLDDYIASQNDYLRKELAKDIELLLTDEINNLNENEDIVSGYEYFIENATAFTFTYDEGVLTLQGEIVGANNDKDTRLELELEQAYNLPDFTEKILLAISSENPEEGSYFDKFEGLEDECVIDGKGKYNTIKNKCIIDVPSSKNNNNNIKIDNTVVYISERIDSWNGFVIDNSHVYVNGMFDAHNGLVIEDSTVYVNGNFKAKNNMTFVKSNLYIFGNLSGKNNSRITNKSKICVAGGVSSDGGFDTDSTSHLYVQSEMSEQDWDSKCSLDPDLNEDVPSFDFTDLDWNDSETEINYP